MENVQDILSLAPIQEGMLLHTIAAPGSGAFVEQFTCLLDGSLDIAAFQAAWAHTVSRHASLRSAFLWDGLEEPVQVVREHVTAGWTIEDRIRSSDPETGLAEFLAQDRARGFRLERAPMLRFALIPEAGSWRFVWTFHHLICDGWSMVRLLAEVSRHYADILRHRPLDTREAPPYSRFIDRLAERNEEAERVFWTDTLSGFTEPTPLPVPEFQGDPTREGRGEIRRTLPRALHTRLQTVAREQRITLSTLFQAAWGLILARHADSDDVVFGVTVSGRPPDVPDVDDIVGCFINTIPLRLKPDEEGSIADYVTSVQQAFLRTTPHHLSPLVRVQQWSELPSGTPLFDSILVFESHPDTPPQDDGGSDLGMTAMRYIGQSNYPLALLVMPGPELEMILVTHAGRIAASEAERLLETVERVLRRFIDHPGAPLHGTEILDAGERELLTTTWARGPALGAHTATVVDRIEDAASSLPDAPAVTNGLSTTLSYGALFDRADALAAVLNKIGVGKNTSVGFCLPRGPEWAIGILGITRAGGAYLPLDPSYPRDRLRYMLEDAGAAALVTTRDAGVPAPAGVASVFLEDVPMHPPVGFVPTRVDSADLAYVIYTSGSTGRPKGVGVTHANLAASTAARSETYRDPVDRFMLLSSFSFDSSVAGFFWTLTTGGTLVVPPDRVEQDIADLLDRFAENGITHTLLLPSLYRVLLEEEREPRLDGLRVVIVAGETCPPGLVARHHRRLPHVALYNEYGPTEATVWCSVHRTSPSDSFGPIPIGRPTPGAALYVLDRRGRPLPAGMPGELAVGGAGVTPGYRNDPALTAERFAEDPFSTSPRARLYRTGDRAGWRPDGTLAFLGRLDGQMKIRGFRIEPQEITRVLLDFPDVREAVVVLQSESVPPSEPDIDRLVDRLSALDPAEAERLLDASAPLDHPSTP